MQYGELSRVHTHIHDLHSIYLYSLHIPLPRPTHVLSQSVLLEKELIAGTYFIIEAYILLVRHHNPPVMQRVANKNNSGKSWTVGGLTLSTGLLAPGGVVKAIGAFI